MKYFATFILLIIMVLPARAQNDHISRHTIDNYTEAYQIPQIIQTDVEGSPYFNEVWQTGYVLLKNGNKSVHAPFKYDTYQNKLLYKKGGKLFSINPQKVKGFVLDEGDHKMIFKKGFRSRKHDISSNQFLRMVYDGHVKVVEAYHAVLHRGTEPDPFSGETTNKFVSKDQYYLITANGKFHKVKLREDDILEALSSPHKSELKNYARSKHLDFGDEHDISKILRVYDKMVKSDN